MPKARRRESLEKSVRLEQRQTSRRVRVPFIGSQKRLVFKETSGRVQSEAAENRKTRLFGTCCLGNGITCSRGVTSLVHHRK